HNIASELYLLRALIAASRGDGRALDDARAGLSLARRALDARNLYPAIALNAGIAAQLRRRQEGDRLLDELLEADGPEPLPSYVLPLAFAALALGRADDALLRLERLVTTLWRDAAIAILRGKAVEAAELLSRIGVQPEEAQARLLAAETFSAAGGEPDAAAQLALCVPFFERVGATAYLDRAAKLQTGGGGPAFAGYRVEGEVGRGGMGVVYRA